jgi:glycosyltransferase involved in cell wall biosynthesis
MLLHMVNVLDRSKYEPVAACPVGGTGALDQLLVGAEVPVIPIPQVQARFTLNPRLLVRYVVSVAGAVRGVRRTIRGADPDLLHANSVRAGLVATLATVGMKVPVIWHVQDDLPRHPVSTVIRWLAFLSRRTCLVAVSGATLRSFTGGLSFGKRASLLYNAIDAERFPRKTVPLDADAALFREELGMVARDFLIATVGMINPRKGLLQLIEQFAEIAGQNPQAHLAVVGAAMFNDDHLYEAELHQRASSLGLLGRVHFTGGRKDIPAILRAADLLVLNATAEPFGLVILEAMASGTPVIATEVGGIPEIIRNGESGQLIPTPDRTSPLNGALSDRLTEAIRNPGTLCSLVEAAILDVLPRFTLHKFSDQLHQIYTQALSDDRRAANGR